ncbi:MAG: PLP-dependent aminotransferase family protein [Nitrospirae bacterium]|nr:PLP-dependent aminotransferase family protein [Nitrospirota bacterium]
MNRQTEPGFLYERVADRITLLIDRGTLRPGDRVPSVRKLSETQDVSISTALQAYRILEDRGMIEARPQSGYYVRPRLWRRPPEPEVSAPASIPTRVGTGDLIMRVLKSVRDPEMVQFGAAVPSPRHPRQSTAYDMPPGNEALRIQVARRMIEAGCTLGPHDLVTTCGAQEALNLCLKAVAKPGDTIAIESPTFYGILQAIEVLGLRALPIPTHPREGVNIEALRFAVEQKRVRACLFVTNYSNPLGSCTSDANKRRLVQTLAERDVPLIEDDIYGDLHFGPERPKVAKAFDRKGLVLLCSSFSKTLAPGYRVGWIAPGRFKERVEYLKFVSNIATPSLPQMAVAEFLSNGGYDRHLRRIRKVYADQVARTTRAISRYFPEGVENALMTLGRLAAETSNRPVR